jgi:predicted nucleic acid-binding protein
MGLILDTSILVRQERDGTPLHGILSTLASRFNETDIAISVVTLAELNHGVYRASSVPIAERRRAFLARVSSRLAVQPLTASIALEVGRIEGEQAARGIAIEFEDLVIGATALAMSFSVVTFNLRHFNRIPGLSVLTL